jgi:tol-pal system protein YbgF
MMFKKTLFAAVLMFSVALPASAQDIATRILNIENQIRDLTGQIEELSFSMKQLQKQLEKNDQSGALEEPAPAPKAEVKKLAMPAPEAESGIEQIGEPEPVAPADTKKLATITGAESVAPVENGEAAIGEQQVAVAPAPGEGVALDGTVQPPAAESAADGIEQVALTPAAESPEALYEKHYEALLRKRYDEAEAGFNDFLQKYPDNSLAGTVQFRLGESFYQRNDFRVAAQHFLKGYTQYAKSRRAPDSLLMLGMSLRKMGEQEKACNAFANVPVEFPRAVEAKKRAAAESKRAGC